MSGTGSGRRYGITVPFDGVSLSEHRAWYDGLLRLGYTDVWSAETDGVDGFTPLALAAAWTPGLRLGVAIIPAYTRGPALLAAERGGDGGGGAGTIHLRPRDVFGRDRQPLERDPLRRALPAGSGHHRLLAGALAGEKVDREFETFTVRGFRLARPVEHPPPIFLAALRPGMLRLGRERGGRGDPQLAVGRGRGDRPSRDGTGTVPAAARIFVCPSEDTETVRAVGRRMIAAYLNVGVYAAFHRWLGRGPELEAMWSAWKAGDRKAALAAIPDETVDALVVHGSFDECRAHVGRYVENGVGIPVMAVIPLGHVARAMRSRASHRPGSRRSATRRLNGRRPRRARRDSGLLVAGDDLRVLVADLVGELVAEPFELDRRAGRRRAPGSAPRARRHCGRR